TTLIILAASYTTLKAQRMPRISTELYLCIYAVLTWFLTSSFYKLMLGTWHTLRGAKANPWHPMHFATEPRPEARVAILFPVYHEDVGRVAAGMAATWGSILKTRPDLATQFESYMLSDSRDIAYWIAEQAAIHQLSANFPDGRFFYRCRASNLNAKIGNVTDFCRRWGQNYDYILVMDADSVMDGDTCIALLCMMEGNRKLGILQTNPKPVLRTSLFGRMQQFAGRLYGAVYSHSLQAMYMGHASYIGHNAMIRTKAFMDHCILPELSGDAPWGGKPLSHDIVESAMMSRAGYEAWFLPELEGSYEEIPANLLSFLMRERRWMQGNLQHLRLLFINGLQSIYRITFLNGSMGYLSAPLWASFLVISGYSMVHFLSTGYLAVGNMTTLAIPMMMLLVSSMVFLFMPRLLALVIYIENGRASLYGGKDKLVWSMVLETLFSFFFSPIMMIYITKFVWLWVKRKTISWGNQQRNDAPLTWRVCVQYFGWVSLLGIVFWVAMGYQVAQVNSTSEVILETFAGSWASPDNILLWFFPILAGFSFSVLIVRFTSRSFPWLMKHNLFMIPEEINVPDVLSDLKKWESVMAESLPDHTDTRAAIAFAVSSKYFFVQHRRETKCRSHVRTQLLSKILGGCTLSDMEMRIALSDRFCFDAIHKLNVRN
ncbi:MAG: glucans biosynthesis glucosyltransferase MdoH, partial [Acidocella sp.]|nr:glucans biosynthesis glucosyltransferase MdoH [Acidocella sp.]